MLAVTCRGVRIDCGVSARHCFRMGIRAYFKGAILAQMSDGTYCIIRELGLVKGGKGLRYHENLLTLTVKGAISKLAEVARYKSHRVPVWQRSRT